MGSIVLGGIDNDLVSVFGVSRAVDVQGELFVAGGRDARTVSFRDGIKGKNDESDEHVTTRSVVERDDEPARTLIESAGADASGWLSIVLDVGRSFSFRQHVDSRNASLAPRNNSPGAMRYVREARLIIRYSSLPDVPTPTLAMTHSPLTCLS